MTAPRGGGITAGLARGQRRLLGAGIAVGAAGVVTTLAQPALLAGLIQAAGLGRPLTGLIVLLVSLFLADAALSSLQGVLIGRAGENIVRDARVLLSGRVLRADLAHLDGQRMGDVHTRLVGDTSLMKVSLTQSLAQIILNGLVVLGCVAMMAWTDPGLMLFTVACLGVAAFSAVGLARSLRRAALANREDTGAFGADLQRVLTALPTVKGAGAEDAEQERLAGLADRVRTSGNRVNLLNALFTPVLNVGLQASLAAVLGIGMVRVTTGAVDPAAFTAFTMYLFYLVSPLVVVFMSIGTYLQGRAALDRVDELSWLPQEDAGGGPAAAAAPREPADGERPAVELRDIVFAYGDRPVLDGVSFTVPARGLTALVGPSGAGKTTVFQLIERFYRPSGGSVLLHGRDIAGMAPPDIRGRVGYVQQDSVAMAGTLRENIAYGAPDATDDDIREAVELAGLSEVVASLPDGLDTLIGDQGNGLSGGQRQRLTVARALVRRPEIVLLDEATAHLDAEAEGALRDSLRRIAGRCAVVAIAHRISTVAEADRIVVLEEGRVRAVGRHEDLLREDGLYRRLATAALVHDPSREAPGTPEPTGFHSSGVSV